MNDSRRISSDADESLRTRAVDLSYSPLLSPDAGSGDEGAGVYRGARIGYLFSGAESRWQGVYEEQLSQAIHPERA